jgi:integrase/recombinase XerD
MAKDLVAVERRALTPAQFGDLAEVPPELEWLANITNPKTRRAYKSDVSEFSTFTGLHQPAELRTITRAHVIAWRKHLGSRELAPSSIRRKLSALSALFDYLCERNAVAGNPVDGVKRPISNNNEGSTPALGDAQARKLLDAPPDDTLKGVRDRAILATLLYHGIRREELCGLRVKDMQSRQGVLHFRVKGKRGKVRFVPIQVLAQTANRGIPGTRRPRRRHLRPRVSSCDQQLHRRSRSPARSSFGVSEYCEKIWAGDRHQRSSERPLRPFASRDRCYEPPRP